MHCHPKSTMENEGLNASTFGGAPLCLLADCATNNKQEIQKKFEFWVFDQQEESHSLMVIV